MYEVAVRRHFTARHRLRGYPPDDGRPHRHRWEVCVRARTPDLGAAGFGLDFQDLDRWLGELLARFDGRVLNDVDPFRELNPSAENLARWIFERLAERFDSLPAALAGVEVREGPRFTATYHPDQASAKP